MFLSLIFPYLKTGTRKVPEAEVLLAALSVKNLDTRLTEAVPWILVKYAGSDW